MKRRRRGSLKGWWRLTPFLLVPFAVVFYEVWLRAEILQNEYVKHGLRSEVRAINARIDDLQDVSHDLARMERVFEHAPDLGLVPPAPGRIVEIDNDTSAQGEFARTRSDDSESVARADGD